MRAILARLAIVVATVLAVVGCRSGGVPPFGIGRTRTEPEMTGHPEPQLPSAGATPPGNAPAYASQAAPGAASPFAEPPGGGQPYPGQPAGYTGMPPGGGAMPGGAGANYAANTAAPQQGPYGESYAQPPAGPMQPYPTTPYPAISTPGAYPPAQPGPASAPPPADPYVSAGPYGATPGGYGAPPPGNEPTPPPMGGPATGGAYQAESPGGPNGYRTADSRSAPSDPYAAQPEQSAADRYGTSSEPAMPAGPTTAPSTREPYQPGSTGYHPGQTGYSPPGVAPYQTPAQPNVVSTPRTEPHYRPGGTSDYLSSSGAPSGNTPTATTPSGATPSASPDRYNTPAIGYDQADPYAQ